MVIVESMPEDTDLNVLQDAIQNLRAWQFENRIPQEAVDSLVRINDWLRYVNRQRQVRFLTFGEVLALRELKKPLQETIDRYAELLSSFEADPSKDPDGGIGIAVRSCKERCENLMRGLFDETHTVYLTIKEWEGHMGP